MVNKYIKQSDLHLIFINIQFLFINYYLVQKNKKAYFLVLNFESFLYSIIIVNDSIYVICDIFFLKDN